MGQAVGPRRRKLAPATERLSNPLPDRRRRDVKEVFLPGELPDRMATGWHPLRMHALDQMHDGAHVGGWRAIPINAVARPSPGAWNPHDPRMPRRCI
ncbi:MAG: hypothetical protein B7Z66_11100 [Chromatiales bacterium 21-64-14]|nr:MAG: hypothetical protein B7Z66_11100 [Chromatiales bacterium 21-64-14]